MVSVRECHAFDLERSIEAAKRWARRHGQHASFQKAGLKRQFSKLDSDARLAKRANRLLTRLNRVAPNKTAEIASDLGLDTQAATQVMRAQVTEETIARKGLDPLLERVMGATRDFQSMEFIDRAAYVAKTVCRIVTAIDDGVRCYGTGFLISPRLLLTNHHVLHDRQAADRSVVEFNYQRDRFGRDLPVETLSLRTGDFFLADAELDFALVAVEGSPGARYGWCPLFKEEGKAVAGEPVNIIQHPRGEPKQIVIRANKVIDLLDGHGPFMHYEADTEPGSSGSPVFNDQWEVIALHHSGVPKRNAKGTLMGVDDKPWRSGDDPFRLAWVGNEGVRVSRLVAFLSAARVRSHEKALLAEVLKPVVPAVEAADHAPRVNGTSIPGPVNLTVPIHVVVSEGR
jgi:endonuclease G, mitochondrial